MIRFYDYIPKTRRKLSDAVVVGSSIRTREMKKKCNSKHTSSTRDTKTPSKGKKEPSIIQHCLLSFMNIQRDRLRTKFRRLSSKSFHKRSLPLSLLLAGLILTTPILLHPVASFHTKIIHSTSSTRTTMVSLTGQTSITFRRSTARMAKKATGGLRPSAAATNNKPMVRPADPQSVISDPSHLEEKALQLADWLSSRNKVFCLTGAGLSTDSGIPDYRGHKGSYHVGHKPIIHQQFMDSAKQRQRYWSRSMVGWKKFDRAQPNKGHYSLAALEQMGKLGVNMEDREEFYDELDKDDFLFTSGQRRLTILTQNVDSLHDRAGSKDVLALHGGNNLVQCMNCGHRMPRNDYQSQLAEINEDWLDEHMKLSYEQSDQQQSQMRPDGDAELRQANYEAVHLPNCPSCNDGFFKPDVVFFGDSVPKHRVAICQQAVENCDGILVVGSSLAVHSAFRHVRAASQRGVSVAILNVGDTRAEAEELEGLVKIEAPIGDTLEHCVKLLGNN